MNKNELVCLKVSCLHTAMVEYSALQPVSAHVLEVFFESAEPSSVESFCQFLFNALPNESNQEVSSCSSSVLLALAEWTNLWLRTLDRILLEISSQPGTQPFASEFSLESSDFSSDFIYFLALELLGPEFSCFANALGKLCSVSESSVTLLSQMVQELERCRAKAALVASEASNEALHWSIKMGFCRYFTVEPVAVDTCLQEHEGRAGLHASSFGIVLIDSCGLLMDLLLHIESLDDLVVAIDVEGAKLSRSGQLCLLQIACNDAPSRVYVLDVVVLPQALYISTPAGTSLKSILEDSRVLKLWFDPRNDVDALYHQFQILPQHIFDLQLAEVATRRSRGLQVKYVSSLQKCLSVCDRLDQAQKTFAEFISRRGKELFEADLGGSYEIFRQRPLFHQILVYSAHDARYMHLLYDYYSDLSEDWKHRILVGSQVRSQWYANPTQVRPSTDAPEF